MTIQYLGYRKKNPWVVTWRSAWTKRKHTKGFPTEQEATNFEQARTEVLAREQAVFRRRKKAQTNTRSRITVKELMESYFALAQANPTTIRQSRYHAAHIIAPFGGRLASQLAREDILNFSEAQKLRGIAQTTINRRVSILRAALNWGVRNGLLSVNPLHDLRMPRARARRLAPPTAPEINAILAAAAPHVQRVIIVGIYTGARIGPSELFRLKWRDVDLEQAMIRMPSAHKNDRQDARDVPIRRALLPLLREWRQQDAARGIATVISWRGRPVCSIARAWRTALEKAGIQRRIRPYDLRHAYATYALAGGADIKTIADLMGHTDASMILKTYQHVLDSQRREAQEAMPDILRLEERRRRCTPPGLRMVA